MDARPDRPVIEGAFETAGGQSVTAVTAAEMRDVDRVAVEDLGLRLLSMMENAGRNLADQVTGLREGGSVAVLAGSGGNGGGGLACARHLANRGVPVEVVLDRPAADLAGAAATQAGVLDGMDVAVDAGPAALASADPALVVDALVGYGLDGPLRGTAADLVDAAPDGATTVALDVPSGRDATTGERPGAAVEPDLVLALALPKTGLREVSAPLVLGDIAIPATVYRRLDIPYARPFGDGYRVELRAT